MCSSDLKNLKVEPMLARQVTIYFEEILKANGRIEEFIDSDYTFMNQTLAKWIYKREGIRGERLRKVALNDPRRGGIFTQPGIMTATANGVETSPVIRGVWVLENRSEEHTSELQSRTKLVCRLLLEQKNKQKKQTNNNKQTDNNYTHVTY